jgi:RsiW-degrading membrane proteinase PrsW (M82 family)
MESIGRVDSKVITWNGQGLFWFLILFLGAIFLLFIPIEFINTFKLYNSNFKDLVTNILYVILFSLASLILFQIFLSSDTQIVRDITGNNKGNFFLRFHCSTSYFIFTTQHPRQPYLDR